MEDDEGYEAEFESSFTVDVADLFSVKILRKFPQVEATIALSKARPWRPLWLLKAPDDIKADVEKYAYKLMNKFFDDQGVLISYMMHDGSLTQEEEEDE